MSSLITLGGVGLLLVFTVSDGALGAAATAQQLEDMRTILQRHRRELLPRDVKAARDRGDGLARRLQEDGTWPEINYKDDVRTGWSPAGHPGRVRMLAKASAVTEGDEKYFAAASKALDYWIKHDPQCANWWYNVINTPRELVDILTLIGDRLTDEQRAALDRMAARATLGHSGVHTGQNLIWQARTAMFRGCLNRDPELVTEAVKRIAGEIVVTMKEGIQHDWSFHQHGAQLYSGGYGAAYMSDCSQLAWMLRNTWWGLSEEKREILARYVLDGQQWMYCGGTMNYSCDGRGISRRKSSRPATRPGGLLKAARYLLETCPKQRDELQQLLDRHDPEKKVEPLTGTKVFWRSDFMVHRSEDLYFSVKFASKRTLLTEAGNGENLKGKHLCDGMTLIMRRGDEYHNIFPVWDWRKLPGVTCRDEGDLRPKDWRAGTGETDFAGGCVASFPVGMLGSAPSGGVAAFDYRSDATDKALRAKKAWFVFGGTMVALGAGITDPTDAGVTTTINQCHLRGDVTILSKPATRTLPRGVHALKNVDAIEHDGVQYIFPQPTDVTVSIKEQVGTWHAINNQYDEKAVKLPVFSAWIDHGKKPVDASYAYVVKAAQQPLAQAVSSARKLVQVASNTEGLQAIIVDDIAYAVFHRAEQMGVPELGSIRPSVPCMLIVDPTHHCLPLSYAEPTLQVGSIDVTIKPRSTTEQRKQSLPVTGGPGSKGESQSGYLY